MRQCNICLRTYIGTCAEASPPSRARGGRAEASARGEGGCGRRAARGGRGQRVSRNVRAVEERHGVQTTARGQRIDFRGACVCVPACVFAASLLCLLVLCVCASSTRPWKQCGDIHFFIHTYRARARLVCTNCTVYMSRTVNSIQLTAKTMTRKGFRLHSTSSSSSGIWLTPHTVVVPCSLLPKPYRGVYYVKPVLGT